MATAKAAGPIHCWKSTIVPAFVALLPKILYLGALARPYQK
jgi:hypothetical protein